MYIIIAIFVKKNYNEKVGKNILQLIREMNMKKNIEELRELLYKILDSAEYNYEEVLTLSQELDELIVHHYKRNIKLSNKVTLDLN